MSGAEGLTPALLAGVTLVTMIGATLQGSVGFGMGMFAVPILLLIDPAFVPGPTLATMALLTLAMTVREWHAVRGRELAWAIAGRVPGVGIAIAFLTILPPSAAEPALGAMVIAAVLLSVSGLRVDPRPGTLVGAGALSGFMGTTVSIGGPPMALLFQHQDGPHVRGTLSAFFTIGVAISLVGLHLVGRFGIEEIRRMGVLLPGTALGFLLSGRLRGVLDRGYLRPAILVVATLMGAAVVVRSLVPADPIRVVSYNMHHGAGTDGRVDLERVASVLRRMEPDVIGLQEVDRGAERTAGVRQADSLGGLLGMSHAFGAFMPYQGGEYGMAILSRFPIDSVQPIRLPEGNEPRVALRVVLRLPDGSRLGVVNVHFDWVEDDRSRYAQASALADSLAARSGPHLLLGDFNDEPASRTLALFAGRYLEAEKPAGDRLTFSSTDPRREIDFIFAWPRDGWRVRSVRVIDQPMASDHRPVLAVLDRR